MTRTYEDIYIQKNLLSPQHIHKLTLQLCHLKQVAQFTYARAAKNGRKNTIYMVKPSTQLHSELEIFLKDNLPFDKTDYSFESINFYELENSYALHCDNLGEQLGFYQVIIPLHCPEDKPTYTIIFDQTSTEKVEWVAPIYKKPRDYKPFVNRPIFDASWFGGWKNEYRISEEDGQKYWGSRWQDTFLEAYKGFSIKYAYEWAVGDIFTFNSHFTHCASELEKLNIALKTGLLICLKKNI